MSQPETPPFEANRLLALLERLDPYAPGPCGVPGCVHHSTPATPEVALPAGGAR